MASCPAVGRNEHYVLTNLPHGINVIRTQCNSWWQILHHELCFLLRLCLSNKKMVPITMSCCLSFIRQPNLVLHLYADVVLLHLDRFMFPAFQMKLVCLSKVLTWQRDWISEVSYGEHVGGWLMVAVCQLSCSRLAMVGAPSLAPSSKANSVHHLTELPGHTGSCQVFFLGSFKYI